MLIKDIILENMPRTLYHGTIKSNLSDILHYGLEPRIGNFTAAVYKRYTDAKIPLRYVIFAADKSKLGACVCAILGQMHHSLYAGKPNHDEFNPTIDDFYKHAAILVFKHAESRFTRRNPDEATDVLNPIHPPQAEPGDYYREINIVPDIVLTGKKLKRFLRNNGIDLADYGLENPDHASKLCPILR
jgi:hypothetical protein